MSSQSELSHNVSKDNIQPLTLLDARRLFIAASVKYPASVFAQSAHMLLELRKRNVGPEGVAQLLSSAPDITKIVTAAQRRHGKKINAHVTKESVQRIIAAEIEIMNDYSSIRDEGLQTILQVFPKLRHKYDEYADFVTIVRRWSAQAG